MDADIALFVHLAKQTWEMAVERDEQMLFPILVVGRNGEVRHHTMVGDFDYDALVWFLADELARRGAPDFLALTIDGYDHTIDIADLDRAKDDLVIGELLDGRITLAELFAQGHPEVRESLIVHYVDKENTLTQYVPYKRDGTTLEWLPEPDLTGIFEGRFLTVLRRAVHAPTEGDLT